MLQLPRANPLDKRTKAQLRKYQKLVNTQKGFIAQSAFAATKFKATNTKKSKTFLAVRNKLKDLCSGAQRCVYCEDSAGNQVEHIFPKQLYPEKTFVWENLVFACIGCNSPKNNKFAVFRADNGAYQEVQPLPKMLPSKPPRGTAVLLHPRYDDPFQFMELDLAVSFDFFSRYSAGTIEDTRARYTYDTVLGLNGNNRELLRQAREEAYEDYKTRLEIYVSNKNSGSPSAKLDRIKQQLQKKQHPTVWKEVQRYYRTGLLIHSDSDFANLFQIAPEALTW